MRISMVVACLTMAGIMCLEKDAPTSTCRVRLVLTDADTGRELAGLLRILDADGRAVKSEQLLSRGLGVTGNSSIDEWLVIPHAVELDLPHGQYTLTAVSGLETEQAQREVKLEGAESKISIPLTRFHDAASLGY